MEQGLITAGAGLVIFALGFLLKALTGEQRANVHMKDADAAKSYSEAAANTAKMMIELQGKIESLTGRVDALEEENDTLRVQVKVLLDENQQLKVMIESKKE